MGVQMSRLVSLAAIAIAAAVIVGNAECRKVSGTKGEQPTRELVKAQGIKLEDPPPQMSQTVQGKTVEVDWYYNYDGTISREPVPHANYRSGKFEHTWWQTGWQIPPTPDPGE